VAIYEDGDALIPYAVYNDKTFTFTSKMTAHVELTPAFYVLDVTVEEKCDDLIFDSSKVPGLADKLGFMIV
jgi:hypothetical protein